MYVKILSNSSLPISRRFVRLIRYCHLKLLGWITLKSRYRAALKEGFFVESSPSPGEMERYREYWRVFGKPVDTDTLIKCFSISGLLAYEIIPEDVFSADIEPSLSPVRDSSFLQNKNIYQNWFSTGGFPESYLHKINGSFYDSKLNAIASIDGFLSSGQIPCRGVLKISYGSSGGAGVQFIASMDELRTKLDSNANLVFQEEILQHDTLSAIYQQSLNSVRACVYRSVGDGSVHVLNMSLRMGKGGSLDNETAGGIVCSVNEGGRLNHFAVDKHGIKFLRHPDTGFEFKGFSVPDIEDAKDLAIEVFKQIPHSYLASLDLCYDASGSWRVIEINLQDQTIRFAQYAGKPFFGDFTEEVRSWVLKNHWAFQQ